MPVGISSNAQILPSKEGLLDTLLSNFRQWLPYGTKDTEQTLSHLDALNKQRSLAAEEGPIYNPKPTTKATPLPSMTQQIMTMLSGDPGALDSLVNPLSIGHILPVLGAAGKETRTLDELWGLIGSDPKWQKAFDKATKLPDDPKYIKLNSSIDDVIEIAKQSDTPENFFNSVKTHLNSLLVDEARSKAARGVVSEVSVETPVGEGGATLGNTLSSTGSSAPTKEGGVWTQGNAEFGNVEAQEEIARLSAEKAAETKTYEERFESLPWYSRLRLLAMKELAKGTEAPVHRVVDPTTLATGKTVTPEKAAKLKRAMKVIEERPAGPGSPPSNILRERAAEWPKAVTNELGLNVSRFYKDRLNLPRERNLIENAQPSGSRYNADQIGAVKRWLSKSSVKVEHIPSILAKHGATPEEAADISKYLTSSPGIQLSAAATVRPKGVKPYIAPMFTTPPARMREILYSATDDFLSAHQTGMRANKASREAVIDRIDRIKNMPKEALYGILSRYGPVSDRTTSVMRKQLIMKILKGEKLELP